MAREEETAVGRFTIVRDPVIVVNGVDISHMCTGFDLSQTGGSLVVYMVTKDDFSIPPELENLPEVFEVSVTTSQSASVAYRFDFEAEPPDIDLSAKCGETFRLVVGFHCIEPVKTRIERPEGGG
jgi:hypothetical protein